MSENCKRCGLPLAKHNPPRVSGSVAYYRCEAWRELSGDAEGIPSDVYDWMWRDKREGRRDFAALDARALELAMGARSASAEEQPR